MITPPTQLNESLHDSQNAHSCEPPRELQTRLLDRLDGLSMFSTAAVEALGMVSQVDCSVPDFCNLIEQDVPLAMNALALANSAFYSPARPTGNLKEAVVRLGMRECKNLILSTCTTIMIREVPLETQWIRDLLWQHSFTTATVCGHLNRILDIGFHGEEHAAGLLHDIGRLLLATVDSESFEAVDELSFDEDDQQLPREQEHFDTDHCQFGAWYAAREGMPNLLIDVIRNHHAPTAAACGGPLVPLVAAADHLANHLQRTGDSAGYDPTTNHAIPVLAEQISPAIEARFVDMHEMILDTARSDIAQFAGITE